MRLGLTSSAAPDAPLSGLLEGCARRGLSDLELGDGHGHGVAVSGGVGPDEARSAAEEGGAAFAGYRVGPTGDPRALAELAGRLESPVVVDAEEPPEMGRRRAEEFRRVGADVRVLVRGPGAEEHARALAADGMAVAWEAVAEDDRLADRFEAMWDATDGALTAIRLRGGGPEAAAQEGGGMGALFGRLALRAFQGPVLLAPSSRRFHVAWRKWLQRGGGWGCGSAGTASRPVQVEPSAGSNPEKGRR